jgi:hypothetical protein
MTAIVLAPFAPAATLFVDLGRLRVQECERVEALRTELTKCGAHVEEIRDSLRIDPGPLRGAEIARGVSQANSRHPQPKHAKAHCDAVILRADRSMLNHTTPSSESLAKKLGKVLRTPCHVDVG